MQVRGAKFIEISFAEHLPPEWYNKLLFFNKDTSSGNILIANEYWYMEAHIRYYLISILAITFFMLIKWLIAKR